MGKPSKVADLQPSQLFKSGKIESEVREWLKKRASNDEFKAVTKVLRRVSDHCGGKWQSRPSSSVGGRSQKSYSGSEHSWNAQRPISAPLSRPGTASYASKAGDHEVELLDFSPTAITTNQLAFGMRDAHPEVYKQAVDAGRAHPMPNLTYKSMWGDSLKKGSDKYAKYGQQTTYQKFNDEVFNQDTATMLTKKRGFLNWAKCNHLYYGDLVSESMVKGISQLLEESNSDDQQEIIETFEKLHAVLTPDKNMSTSHALHRGFRSMGNARGPKAPKKAWEDIGQPSTEKRPPESSTRRQARDDTTSSERAGSDEVEKAENLSARRGSSTYHTKSQKTSSSGIPKPDIQTFASSVPLNWMGHVHQPYNSSYRQTFCRDNRDPAAQASAPIADKDSTILAPHRGTLLPRWNSSDQVAYPVPDGFVKRAHMPGEPRRNQAETTSRHFFLPRSRVDVARSAKTAAAAISRSKAIGAISSIPLGRKGINLPSNWRSVYAADFKHFQIDAQSSQSTRELIHATVSRPTGPVGALAPKTLLAAK